MGAAAPRGGRSARPDAVLTEAVEAAREGLDGVAAAGAVGEHRGARTVGERLVTHSFECLLRGYGGWQWEVTIARAPRSKRVTVCEAHLAPAEGALLAPEWVPWADRLRPEDFGVADAKAEEPQLVLVAPAALPVRPGVAQPERVAARCENCDCAGYLVPVESLRADRAALAEPEPDPLPDPLVDDYELEAVVLSEEAE
ncbi:DUF3027 domain-containing protein [Kytococcus sp. Marseille-QA3725]